MHFAAESARNAASKLFRPCPADRIRFIATGRTRTRAACRRPRLRDAAGLVAPAALPAGGSATRPPLGPRACAPCACALVKLPISQSADDAPSSARPSSCHPTPQIIRPAAGWRAGVIYSVGVQCSAHPFFRSRPWWGGRKVFCCRRPPNGHLSDSCPPAPHHNQADVPAFRVHFAHPLGA